MTSFLAEGSLGFWSVPLAMVGQALRVSAPYLYVSLGETLTEKSGRVNLGLQGTLIMGAMAGYAVSSRSGSALAGVLAAGVVGGLLGILHAFLCARPKVNDIAVGIALMIFGVGLASFLGRPYIKPERVPAMSPDISLGFWSANETVRANLQVNLMFVVGVALVPLIAWGLKNTRWGLILRSVGENADTARAMGYSINGVRLLATMAGGVLAGLGGAFLTLAMQGGWKDGLAPGTGLMAVALVIFARWKPLNCLWAALLFGGAGAIAPALQSVGLNEVKINLGFTQLRWGRYVFEMIPYLLTLGIMIFTSSGSRQMAGIPDELTRARWL
ncbi:MAG: simple sugar transport system permease protein [Phycisphaerales bacterium]|nr:simple sugar transport system permease protein [Phycisphaerales bacterium]